tara:strand:+ start:112 stop:756 length:645 start_codon:yes stop_codon:yes gene_type:complete
MSKTQQLTLGMGSMSLLMHDGDACTNVKGYAVQALEECVFSQFKLDETPIHPTEQSHIITAVTNADNEFEVADITATNLKVNDRVLIRLNGASAAPTGLLTQDQIYYIQAIDTASNEFKISATEGGSAIAISSDGTGYEGVATVAKVVKQNNNSHGDFTISGGTTLENTNQVSGNADMFDTDGAEDVKIPAGMTVYLPVNEITLTTGACIVYIR